MIELKEPVKTIPTDDDKYLAILEDADGVVHFWLPDGTYDGYDRPCEPPKAAKDEQR